MALVRLPDPSLGRWVSVWVERGGGEGWERGAGWWLRHEEALG